MQMNGLAELITVAHYYRQWADPRLIVAVLHNNDLNQVTWEMRAMSGSPKFAESQTLPDVDYAAFARSLGLDGVNVDNADDVGPAWEQALGCRPAHRARCAVRPRCAAHSTACDLGPGKPRPLSAIVHGDENAWGFVKQGVKQKLQEFLPGTKD